MKKVSVCIAFLCCLLIANASLGASAKCVVVEKNGNVLVMDCGDRADGFKKDTKVKIKTDRGKR